MLVQDESLLRTPCKQVEDPMGEGLEIARQLSSVLRKYEGIGLAANQIGLDRQVCIISVPGDEHYYEQFFVNPKITEFSNPIRFPEEGCLSFPDDNIETLRFESVFVVDALSPEGRRLTGLSAVVAYHEIDHLMGITMFDRKIKNIGVNDKCPCLSGLKFKKCCRGKIKAYKDNEA